MDLSQVSDADLLASIPVGQGGPQAAPGGPWDDFAHPADVAAMVAAEAQRQGVDPRLALRVANRESSFNPTAISAKGAMGVMGLMPGTARDLGVDPRDLRQNIRGGVTYLKRQLDTFGSPELALAAYNAGPGAVQKYGGVPPYAETQKYVRTAMGSPDAQTGADIFADTPPAAATTPQSGGSGADIFADPPRGHSGGAAQAGDGTFADPPASPRNSSNNLAGVSDADLLASLPPSMRGRQQGGPRAAQQAQRNAPAQPPLTTLSSDFLAPAKGAWEALQADAKRYANGVLSKPPPGVSGLSQLIPGNSPRDRAFGSMLADAAALVGSPFSGAMNALVSQPGARLMDRIPLQAYTAPTIQAGPGGLSVAPGRPMSPAQKHAANVGAINTALSGGAPANFDLAAARAASLAATPAVGTNLTHQVAGVAPQMPLGHPAIYTPPPVSLDDLRKASDAAWSKVDASTYRVPNGDMQGAASDIGQLVDDAGGRALYPKSAAIADRVQALADAGDMTVGKLNRLKSQAGMKLLGPGSDEVDVGGAIRDRLENLILNSGDPSIAPARDLYTRLKKMQAVTDAIGSADLTPAGAANIPNKLRPYIDPKSSQQIRNLTPAEVQAMRTVVKGDPMTNALGALGRLSLNGPVSGPIMGGLGVPTKGVTIGLGIAGNVAKAAKQSRILGNVQDLLDLLSQGGAPAAPAAAPMTLPGFRGLFGSGVVSAPFLRHPAPAPQVTGGPAAQRH